MNIDPWSYTREELSEWAYSATDSIPDQDWGLSVANSGYDELILELANDSNCPNKDVMLGCLYMITGDLVVGRWNAERIKEVETLIECAEKLGGTGVLKWAKESRALIANPDSFNYEYWCDRV